MSEAGNYKIHDEVSKGSFSNENSAERVRESLVEGEGEGHQGVKVSASTFIVASPALERGAACPGGIV